MVKSKIKQNPYAQFYLRQIEAMEQQRQYWLKHPREFVKDAMRIMVSCNPNCTFEDKRKLEQILREGYD